MIVDALRLGAGTLTAIPVSAPRRVDQAVAGRAMLLAPVAAAPLALMAAVIAWAGQTLGSAPLVTAAVIVTALALGTRAMHLDGLADTADGLSAGYDRERALEVMRTGDVGPSGAAAIGLVVLLDTAALSALLPHDRSPVLVALAVLLSRHSLAMACAQGVPAARPDGLGAMVAGSVSRKALSLTMVGAIALSTTATTWVGLDWWAGPVMWLAVAAATAAVVERAVRRLGGISGDILGCVIETSLAVTLVVTSVLAG